MMLDISKITKVYSGRIGCMCGCRGKYSYTELGAKNDNPGYDVSDKVNERSVRIIANKVLNSPYIVTEGNMAYIQDYTTHRIRAVYFTGQVA
jgi:hypothetical protein